MASFIKIDLDALVVQVEGLDLEEVIGSGEYGRVFKVTVNGRKCAAKKLYTILLKQGSIGQRRNFISKFRDECRILSALDHPNVVSFVGVHYGHDKNDISLIMERLHSNLANFVETHPAAKLTTRIHILYDVSKGLCYLHSLTPPLLHLDLTAPNIMLTEDFAAKIGDLGVSRYVDPKKLTCVLTSIPGNPSYIPPECHDERPTYSTKFDIFSFGHLIIHTVIGDFPKVFDIPYDASKYVDDGKVELMRRDKAVHGEKMGKKHVLYPLVVRCLNDRPQQRPSIDEVSSSLGQLVVSAQLQNLLAKDNLIKMKHLKMFFIGPPNVGKTVTRLRLCNEMKNISLEPHLLPDSTLLANCKQVLMHIDSQSGSNKWITSSSLNEDVQILFRYMCLAESSASPKICHHDSSPEPKKVPFIPPSAGSTSLKDILLAAQDIFARIGKFFVRRDLQPPQKSSMNKEDTSGQSKVDDVMAKLQTLIQTGDYPKFAERVDSSMLVNIHDIGGQPGFLEMIPSLIGGPSAYLVFFNLSLPLDQQYKIPFNRDGTVITPFDSMNTVENTISQVLTAISSIDQNTSATASNSSSIDQINTSATASNASSIDQNTSATASNVSSIDQNTSATASKTSSRPVATLVGTHLDKLEEGTLSVEEQLKQKHKALKHITDNFSQVIVNPEGDKTFLALNNQNGTENLDIRPLQDHIMKLINDRLDASLPIRPAWLILSIILRTEYKTIASLDDCLEIGRILKMDEKEVKKALKYLHDVVGALMYYPDINDKDRWFKGKVFCSPQVVFDSIGQIIVVSLQVLHSDSPVRECFRKDWIERGLFSIEAINEIINESDSQRIIPYDKLIQLLEHVNLISKIEVKNPLPGNPSVLLFMPAMLDCVEIKEAPQPNTNTPAPILIRFEFGYVPTGVFCGLITKIATKGKAKILGESWELKKYQPNPNPGKDNREKYQVKRNRVSFLLGGLHIVTLISHNTCYEIRIERKGTSISLVNLCSQVLSSILFILKDLYKRLDPIIAFHCPCDKVVPGAALNHICTVGEVVICTSEEQGGPSEVELRKEHKVWIGKEAKIGEKICFQIMKSSKDLSVQWSREDECIHTPKPHILQIDLVTDSHFGVYKCEVSEEGELKFTMYKHLFKKESHDQVMNMAATAHVHTRPLFGVTDPKRRCRVSEYQLDTEIPTDDLHTLAGCFDNYALFLDKLLPISAEHQDMKSIQIQYGHQSAMRETLKLWQKHNPGAATFRALLQITQKLKKETVTENIYNYIHEHIPSQKLKSENIDF